MLATSEVIEAVAEGLEDFPGVPVVLDPVMVAASGDLLLDEDAVETLRALLVPRADLITPNLPEAAKLLGGDEAEDEDEMAAQAQALMRARRQGRVDQRRPRRRRRRRSISCSTARVICGSKRRAWRPEHARHRLHALLGHRRRACQGRLAARGRDDGQGLCHRAQSRRPTSFPSARAGAPCTISTLVAAKTGEARG